MSAQLVAGPRVDAWQDYAKATRGDYFAAWCGDELVHGGDFENEPFVLEEWQRALMNEALALRDWRLDDDGELAAWLPYWRTFGAVVPRGNGKSPLIAAMAIDHLFAWLSDPRVFIAASDEKQARLLFEYVCHYLRSGSHPWQEGVDFVIRETVGEVSLVAREGFIKTIATNKPGGLHGERPSLAICDELHEWRTGTQRRSYDAIVTGARKRPGGQVVIITTAGEAGERATSLLGTLVDATHERGQTEQVHRALRISRLHESRTIVAEWSAPTQDPDNIDAIKLANPASWRTEAELAEAAAAPDITPQTFLQFYGNVWSESKDAWIKRAVWGQMRVDELAPASGTPIMVGIDAATTEDCTAVAWSWRLPGDRVAVACHVWAAKHGNAAHVFSPGGAIDKRCVIPFIRDVLVAERGLVVEEIVTDPARFDTEARMLEEEGFLVAPLWGKAALRSMAWTHWYGAVTHGRLAHDGDAVLAEHVCGAEAVMAEHGWHVTKLKQRRAQKIDALVAAAMATWRWSVHHEDDGEILMEVWE